MLRLVSRARSGDNWIRPDAMPPLIYRLLLGRGIESAEEARRFLAPSLRDLSDPFRLNDMERAAARLNAAREKGEKITVWGDYDVDGVSATALLTLFLKNWGANADFYIPSRKEEGYGLNDAGVRRLAEAGTKLLVTVDAGVSGAEQVRLAESLGVNCIVTDHHRPPEVLPDCPLVNPLLNAYPFPYLCGTGVAFQLARALDGEAAAAYLDLAALATVADLVPLTGENRALTSLGLRAMNCDPRPGLSALIRAAGIEAGGVTAGRIGFQLGPRLNADGRLGDARRALRLLMTESAEEAEALAAALEKENTGRRQEEKRVLNEALAALPPRDLTERRVIVLAGENWEPGVVGLAAGRLAERYALPTVLLTRREDGTLSGSCRSVPGVDIYECLKSAEKHLLRYGGHAQAAGLTLKAESLDDFRNDLDAYIQKTEPEELFVPAKEYDLPARLGDLDLETVKLLKRLEPTGIGNPAPVFRVEAESLGARRIGKDLSHLSLELSEGEDSLRAVFFSAGAREKELAGGCLTLLGAPEINAFMGRERVEMQIRAALPADPAGQIPAGEALEALAERFLIDRADRIRALGEAPRAARSAPLDALALLRASPRGTLLCFTDAARARSFLDRARAEGLGERLDFFAGRWPEDPRAFNAACLLPPGDAPDRYPRVVGCDAPGALFSDAAAACGPAGKNETLAALPDIDGLRRLYAFLKKLLVRPYAQMGAATLARETGEGSGQSPVSALMGLMILSDMELIDFTPAPLKIALRPMKRCDPGRSALFRGAGILRNGGINDAESGEG